MNKSGILPLGRAVLTEPYEPQRKESVIAIPEWVNERERVLDVCVRVVDIGPSCWPDEPARCAIGDIVYVAKFSGFVSTGQDGKHYRLVNDRDVFAKLVPQGEAYV